MKRVLIKDDYLKKKKLGSWFEKISYYIPVVQPPLYFKIFGNALLSATTASLNDNKIPPASTKAASLSASASSNPANSPANTTAYENIIIISISCWELF